MRATLPKIIRDRVTTDNLSSKREMHKSSGDVAINVTSAALTWNVINGFGCSGSMWNQPILCRSAHRRETFITAHKAHLHIQCSYKYLVSAPDAGDGESQHMGTSTQSHGEIYWFMSDRYELLAQNCPRAMAGLVTSSHQVPDLSFILGLWEESKSTQQELNHSDIFISHWISCHIRADMFECSRGHEDGRNSSLTVAVPPPHLALGWHEPFCTWASILLSHPSERVFFQEGGVPAPKARSSAIISGLLNADIFTTKSTPVADFLQPSNMMSGNKHQPVQATTKQVKEHWAKT